MTVKTTINLTSDQRRELLRLISAVANGEVHEGKVSLYLTDKDRDFYRQLNTIVDPYGRPSEPTLAIHVTDPGLPQPS